MNVLVRGATQGKAEKNWKYLAILIIVLRSFTTTLLSAQKGGRRKRNEIVRGKNGKGLYLSRKGRFCEAACHFLHSLVEWSELE
jgi:hypothetical protein